MKPLDEMFTFPQNSFVPVLSLSVFLVSYLIYWSIFARGEGRLKDLVISRVSGFLLLGPVSVSALYLAAGISPKNLGLSVPGGTWDFIFITSIILCIPAVAVNAFNAGKDRNLQKYPQIRQKVWNKSTLAINTVTWILYLTGYEIMFRGILLFPLVETWGIWPAITVNTVLYSVTHIPKGTEEAYGAIIMGIILSFITVYSGSIWIAVIVHIALGLSNSLFALRYHEEIGIKPGEKEGLA